MHLEGGSYDLYVVGTESMRAFEERIHGVREVWIGFYDLYVLGTESMKENTSQVHLKRVEGETFDLHVQWD